MGHAEVMLWLSYYVAALCPLANLHLQLPLQCASVGLLSCSCDGKHVPRSISACMPRYDCAAVVLWSAELTVVSTFFFSFEDDPKGFICLIKLYLFTAVVVLGLQVFQRCRELGTRCLAGAPQGRADCLSSELSSSVASRTGIYDFEDLTETAMDAQSKGETEKYSGKLMLVFRCSRGRRKNYFNENIIDVKWQTKYGGEPHRYWPPT